MSTSFKPIGGYFELELADSKKAKFENALYFQSARSAFLALLRAVKPTRVWMPTYICNSMIAPVEAAGATVSYYGIDERFGVADPVKLASKDILVYVNYFGICQNEILDVLTKFNPHQVVFDFSQAFYADPPDCLGVIYSPRKFFGVPDGGLLISSLPIALPAAIDTESEFRMTHLVRRLSSNPESGYEDYQKAEASLGMLEPKQMSHLTGRILSSIDFEVVKSKRNKNFLMLHAALGKRNKLNIDIGKVDGPLCYPYLTDGKPLRKKLIAARVFIPTYWIDVLNRVRDDAFEKRLVKQCLPLPCDQRYGQKDMARIVDLLA